MYTLRMRLIACWYSDVSRTVVADAPYSVLVQ